MSYIEFDQKKLVNLEYSLSKELIRTNRKGSFASTTIIGCNTRKYHGLLIAPQPQIDNEMHLFLSSLDVTVIQREAEFNLAVHRFKDGVYNPKGHKYVVELTSDPIPGMVYRVGGVKLLIERLFSQDADRFMIRYTLLDAHSPTKLRFKPMIAFRNYHSLSKANVFVNKKYDQVPNGIKIRMYDGYSDLFMQFSKETEYTHVPDWYYDFEYIREKERGYDSLEDLYVPGFFEMPINKGESFVFSASLDEVNPTYLKRSFNTEIKKRTPRDSFEHCLQNSAQQFISRRGKKTEITAGYPWFGRWGRDTFISLPGLTLENGDAKTCKAVIDTMIADLKGPLFPNIGSGSNSAYNSVDAPLWFFWALQKYAEHTKSKGDIWKEYGKKMKMVLEGYLKGTDYNIHMKENGLIYAGEQGKALTWMDAISAGKPVTPRIGMPVEINALWYNAVMFSIEVADLAGDNRFVELWKPISELIPISFVEIFWSNEKQYLADYVNGDKKDWAVRPNMVFATSLPYSPIDEDKKSAVLAIIQKELLTTKGLRTLAPKNPDYEGEYFGDQPTRDKQYHQGTVWPWLFGHYAEGYLKLYGKKGAKKIEWYYEQFEEEMLDHGIGSISEIYDGNPPHKAKGAISQAWSIAELIRVGNMLKKYKKQK